MVVKVCGIKTKSNIEMLSKLDVDMVGLNFYPPSVRFVSEDTSPAEFDFLPSNMNRVGVFVNATLEKIIEKANRYNLDYIQLHGDEDIEFCKSVAERYKLIKVFRIDHSFDFDDLSAFDFAEYFLFDTATKNYGGSGKKFNWDVLDSYNGETPFLLSGGIGPADVQHLSEVKHDRFDGIDINSKFESDPGVKDEDLLVPFLESFKSI